ncbi:hypothetical protein PYCC9005_003257 [Savitreella phatthalungensis]
MLLLPADEAVSGTDKVRLPEEILRGLPEEVQYPLIFKLSCRAGYVHVGVREFTAPNGTIALPVGIRENLHSGIDERITIERVALPKGTDVALRPLDKYDMAIDWKAQLEESFRSYTALTKGQTVSLAGTRFVVEKLSPADAVCIIDTDMELEMVDHHAEDRSIQVGQQTRGGVLVGYDRSKPIHLIVRGETTGVSVGTQTHFAARKVKLLTMEDPDLEIVVHGPGSVEASQDDLQECPTCGLPVQALALHAARCRWRADWTCAKCDEQGVGSIEWHNQVKHVTIACTCGKMGDYVALLTHRASDCPDRLVICRFCKLRQRQGVQDAADRLSGMSHHEAECGGRTSDCDICKRPVKLRNLEAHARIHEQERLQKPTPRICANINCVHLAKDALCSECAGPLYSTQHDPDGSKLRSRIRRRHLAQLVTGCGNAWCRNVKCATASGETMSIATAAKHLPEGFAFCVSEQMQRKRNLADRLECQGEYDIAWCCRAADIAPENPSAWLSREARRKND